MKLGKLLDLRKNLWRTNDMKFSDLKVGDKIVIVKSRVGSGWSSYGGMDFYLGKTLTVSSLNGSYVRTFDNGWCWYENMIDFVETEKLKDFKPSDLRDGDKLYVREGLSRIAIPSFDATAKENGTWGIKPSQYSDNLTYKSNNDFDIMKIERHGVIIWERPKEVKIVKITASELLEKLGLDGNTKLEIV